MKPSENHSRHKWAKAGARLLILGILLSFFLSFARNPEEFWVYFLGIYLPLIFILAGDELEK